MRADSRRILYPLTATIIGAYFLFFAGRSAGSYFDPDDMMNLYIVWSKPWSALLKAIPFFWSDFYRPMGELFYRTMFAMAGFNPQPFRLACLIIAMGNIGLCFWFLKLVSGSERAGAVGSLIFAFHPRLIEVWYRTAVIFDLLCFTFFFLAACLYIDARQRNRLGAWRIAAILCCFIAALDCKEMAVALPVVLLVWELLFGAGNFKRFWLAGVMGAMNLPYLWGKTHGASLLANNPFYKPEYSWERFSHSWARYLNYLAMRETIEPWTAMALLALLLVLALALRSRVLGLAWAVIVFATLPVSFIPERGGFVLYLAWAGWVLYASEVLVRLEDLIVIRWPQYRIPVACVVFLLVGWRMGKMNLHDQRQDPRRWLYDPADNVKSTAVQMRRLEPSLPRGARILFLEDSFTTDEWTPYFIMKLAYHDDTMVVDRVKMMASKTPDWKDYQFVFTCEHGVYRQLKP